MSDSIPLTGTGTRVSAPLTVHDAPRRLATINVSCDAGEKVKLDWISVQNAEDVFPPTSELSISWDDVDAPGGGLSTTVVRSTDGLNVYAGSDVGGVARLAIDDPNWVTINGMGETGLTSQADLGVWDVLQVDVPDPDPDVLYVLSGHPFADTSSWNELALAGSLWASEDDGDTWTRLAVARGRRELVDLPGRARLRRGRLRPVQRLRGHRWVPAHGLRRREAPGG